jgi:hypothetical protein
MKKEAQSFESPMPSANHGADGRMLRRKEAARYLTEKRGLPVAAQTLAKLAVIGGGPSFRKFGRFPVYRAADLDRWADMRLGPIQRSTSDPKEPVR